MPLAYPLVMSQERSSATRVSTVSAEAEWGKQARFWNSIGVTRLSLANYYESGHLYRIAGRYLSDHVAAMKRYWTQSPTCFTAPKIAASLFERNTCRDND